MVKSGPLSAVVITPRCRRGTLILPVTSACVNNILILCGRNETLIKGPTRNNHLGNGKPFSKLLDSIISTSFLNNPPPAPNENRSRNQKLGGNGIAEHFYWSIAFILIEIVVYLFRPQLYMNDFMCQRENLSMTTIGTVDENKRGIFIHQGKCTELLGVQRAMRIVTHNPIEHHYYTGIRTVLTQKLKGLINWHDSTIFEIPFHMQLQNATNIVGQLHGCGLSYLIRAHKGKIPLTTFHDVLAHPFLSGLHIRQSIGELPRRLSDGRIGDSTVSEHRRDIINRMIRGKIADWDSQLLAELGKLVNGGNGFACPSSFDLTVIVVSETLERPDFRDPIPDGSGYRHTYRRTHNAPPSPLQLICPV